MPATGHRQVRALTLPANHLASPACGLASWPVPLPDPAKAQIFQLDEVIHAEMRALAAKNFDTAANEFEEAVRLYKENHVAWFHLGESYRYKKVWDKAVAAYTNAVQLKPGDVMYQLRLGASMYEAAVDKALVDTGVNK